MWSGVGPSRRYLGKSIPHIGPCLCKGPEVEVCLTCSENSKDSVAGREGVCGSEKMIKKTYGTRPHRAFSAMVETLAAVLTEEGAWEGVRQQRDRHELRCAVQGATLVTVWDIGHRGPGGNRTTGPGVQVVHCSRAGSRVWRWGRRGASFSDSPKVP